LDEKTATFSVATAQTAMAVYQKVSDLGPISSTEPSVNPVGITHTVSVDLGSRPLPLPPAVAGIPVKFQIDGVNSAQSGSVLTDSKGKATFTYTGTAEGMDRIWAYLDSDGDGAWDSGEPTITGSSLTKFWVKNFVTAGGNIKVGKNVIGTFSGSVGVLPDGGAVGQFEIADKVAKVTYTLNQFTVLTFSGPEAGSPDATHNMARFRGMGTRSSDGARVEVVVVLQDNGEPGKDVDKFAAEVARVGTSTPGKPNFPNDNIQIVKLLGSEIHTGESYYPNQPPQPPDPIKFVTISGGNIQVHDLK